MKKYILIFTLIASILMITIPVQATPYIDLISASCHAEGYISNRWTGQPDIPNIPFNESSALSIGVSNELPWGTFGVGSASFDVGESTASLVASWGYGEFSSWGLFEAAIEFRPIGASYIRLSANAGGSGTSSEGIFELWDVTTGERLFYFGAIAGGKECRFYPALPDLIPVSVLPGPIYNYYPYYGTLNPSLLIPVDPSHVYDLSTFAWGMGESAHVRADISLGVPEPATMLLLGSCLIGLVVLRRKFKK